MNDFRFFIKNLILKTRLDSNQIHKLLSNENMVLFKEAFIHYSHNTRINYEVYEQLGDITVNKFLVWYFHERFPNLHNTLGVKIIARLRINYGSKQFLGMLADRLGFWNFIKYSTQEVMSPIKKISLLEDVFEAFIGVTEYIIDCKIYKGFGYICCYRLLKDIFDSIPINISYENLFDAKTRLKEIFDINKEILGTQKFEYDKNSNTIYIYRVLNNEEFLLAKANSQINKSDAEQKACDDALKLLKNMGFNKQIPEEYNQLLTKISKE